MRNLKRFMSASLATLMIALALMTGAQAKSYTDVAPTAPYAEQIEILSDIGVIKGTSDTEFSPDQDVTREQMAMLLFRLMIGKDTAGKVNTTSFTDLYDDTYAGAISWANASGYILGTSGTTFSPRSGITLQDAMTMIVRVLGHDTPKMNQGYPWTYIDTAVNLGLDKDIEKLDYTKTLTRAEVSAILYNALTAEYLIQRTAPNGTVYYESTTIIERVFGYSIDEAVIVATNNYAIDGLNAVTKKNYVTVQTEDALFTVDYSQLGIDGTADANLGESFRLVYKLDDKTKLVSVLGCTEIGKSVSAEKIEIDEEFEAVTIDGTEYQVVEELSDSLATNDNELLVFAYGNGARLTQVESNEELHALLGAYDARLIFDDKNSETASRLIIKPFAFDTLEIDGDEINLAEGIDPEDLTFVNDVKAKDGDYVLYYLNEAKETLEIAAVLEASDSETVTRITSETATIGGKRYTLGEERLGVSPESIRAQLSVGEKVKVIAHGDKILAIDSTVASLHGASQYLIADSEATPVFESGKLTYVIDAVIDGKEETILVTNRTVTEGKVYRYIIDGDGRYTLIAVRVEDDKIVSGEDEFVQSDRRNDEIAFTVESADSTTITKSDSYFTLDAGSAEAVTSVGEMESIRFIMDKNTKVIVKIGDTYQAVSGAYNSSITVNDGAAVTAIFENEVGSVEALRFMYISDGELGSVDNAAHSVKVIASEGKELVDGKVYNLYTVLNLATGKVESMMSESASLTEGTNYLTTMNGLISTTEATVGGGVVSGYTASTVTIGGDTYKYTSDTKFFSLDMEEETTKAVTLEDVFMGNVEFVSEDGALKSVILLGKATFEAEHSEGSITVSAVEALTDADSISFTSLHVFDEEQDKNVAVDSEGFTVSESEGETLTFVIDAGEALEAGEYTLRFKVNGVSFTVKFAVE